MRARINGGWMRHVTFRDAGSTVIEPGVELGVDVELGHGVSLRGTTRVGRGAHIDDGVVLIDTVVGAGARVSPYSVAVGAVIAAGADIAPFTHLRADPAGAPAAPNNDKSGRAVAARAKRATTPTKKAAAARAPKVGRGAARDADRTSRST